MSQSMLGSPGEDLLGLVLDFGVKLKNKTISVDQAKHFLRGDAVEGAKRQSLRLILTTVLDAIPEKKTKDCFVGSQYYYRDSDFDSWLPKQQPAQPAGSITAYQLTKQMTFAEMAVAVLGVPAGTPIETLASLLIERGHTTTLFAIETLIERQESGEDIGLRTDGWGNFAFVEDDNGSVSVVPIIRSDGRWGADVRRLRHDYRSNADFRLLVRNSDASKL